MVSVQPENLPAELGVKPGENRDGVRFAQNMCPSKGTMDVFVEPVLPHLSLVVLGGSPVALSLAIQARQLGYHVTVAAPASDLPEAPDADMLIDG
jgi:xanthine dehydrogenase accessory factor